MDDLLSRVQGIFAEITRYPLDVLEPDADLEDDLGIDSVKRAEILMVFRDRFGIPEQLDVEPDELRTIRSITGVIARFVGPAPGAATGDGRGDVRGDARAPLAAATAAVGRSSDTQLKAGAPATSADLADTVIRTFAEVTRYPRDILVPDAMLEDDLGIDAWKLTEIVAVLRQRLHLQDGAQLATAQTVGDVISITRQLTSTRPQAPVDTVDSTGTSGRAHATPGLLPSARPFEGKIAFITGSGHGIGRVMALQLADLGARVIVNSFHSRERGEQTTADIRQAGGDATHLWGSVAKPEHLGRMFGEIEQQFGRLDFFISNASNGVFARLEDIAPEHWDRSFKTNVVALHQGSVLAAKLMRPAGGKIVALSSPGAQRYIEYFGCLGPIKAAVESLVRYLSVELAPLNIQVNAVSMGPIYGELLSKYPDKERLIPYWESLSMDKRLGNETDIANVVMHLLSPVTDRITGTVTLVDIGGSQRI